MSIFENRPSSPQWIGPVSVMCLVLGFMISMAWVTQENRHSRLNFLSPEQNRRISEATVDIDGMAELSNEVAKLRAERTRLESALTQKNDATKAIDVSLQDYKRLASITDLTGPGIVITLRDGPRASGGDYGQLSESVIHDTDVLRTVNELFASGAEAISVNGHRVGPRTAFRCVGPTIMVNDVKIASPIEIRAIGDTPTLLGAMNLPGGILAEIRQADPGMVSIEKVETQTIKAFVGNTQFRVGKVPPAPVPSAANP